jgi:uncharacterized membrane-anchored protein YitT (DUF2179 family)
MSLTDDDDDGDDDAGAPSKMFQTIHAVYIISLLFSSIMKTHDAVEIQMLIRNRQDSLNIQALE